MPVIGPRMSVDLALPAGIDASRILGFQMRNGKTAQEIIAEAAAIIGTVNERVMARYRAISFLTPLQYAMYAQGQGARETPVKVEGKQADPVRSDTLGHMLPLRDYEDANAWTPLYLRDAWDAQITADLQLIADSWEARVDGDVLRRIFSNAENPIGTAGYDVPWAIGSGVNVPYIPPQTPGWPAFDSTHSHFVTQSGTWNAANAAALLEKMVVHLIHHGHTGRLLGLVSGADVSIYKAITGGKFVELLPSGVTMVTGGSNPVAVASGETTGAPGEVFGLYRSDAGPVVELRSIQRIPTKYLFLTKSYGENSIRNGLAIREHPATGFGLRADPQLTRSIQPELEYVQFKAVHGVGVNDRLNGVVGQGGTDSYTPPTI